jgi:hypothetical protein
MSRKITLPSYAGPTELPPSTLNGVKGGQHVTQSDAENDPVMATAKKHWASDSHKPKWNAKVVEEIADSYFGSANWDGRKIMLLELMQYLEKVSLNTTHHVKLLIVDRRSSIGSLSFYGHTLPLARAHLTIHFPFVLW